MRRGFLRDTRGAAAAEMALILPAVAFILVNVVDLGLYLYTKMQVDLAAQEAVGAARVLCDTSAEIPAMTNCGGGGSVLRGTLQTAAQTTSLGASVTVPTLTEGYYCATSTGSLNAVSSSPVPANCSGTVTGSTAKPGDYISAVATHQFVPIFPGASVASVLPATISRTAWIRLR